MADTPVTFSSLPFKEQIAFFRRKLNLPTEAWTDIFNEQHDHAFVVAGANRDDLVADFRAAVDKVISQGTTLADFRKDFDAIVAKYGWSYNGGRNWRSRVIYETNLRTSYAAGRYEQLQAVKALRPYWRYRHSDSVLHPRPMHLAWNGLVLHADDPWWQTHFPPNGWGCECTVESLSDRDLVKLGKSGPDTAPSVDMQTVTVGQKGPSPRTVETPAGVDPGFGYQPGAASFGSQVAQALTTTAQMPATWAAESAAQTLAVPSAADAVDAQFEQWFADVLADPLPRGRAMTIGAMSPDIVAALQKAGLEPATAAIVVRDADVLQALNATRSAPVIDGIPAKPFSPQQIQQLPALLRNPRAVLVQPDQRALLYVTYASMPGEALQVLRVSFPATKEASGLVNLLRTASLATEADLQAQTDAGQLSLVDGSMDPP